jgi:hypothetical protein
VFAEIGVLFYLPLIMEGIEEGSELLPFSGLGIDLFEPFYDP